MRKSSENQRMLGDMRDAWSLVLGSVDRHVGATVRHYYCRLLEAQLKQLSDCRMLAMMGWNMKSCSLLLGT